MIRRQFFLAPALIAASSLMPGHGIGHLLREPEPALRKFIDVAVDPLWSAFGDPGEPLIWGITDRHCQGVLVRLTPAEVAAVLNPLTRDRVLADWRA